MATEVKQQATPVSSKPVSGIRTEEFWVRNGKYIAYVIGGILLLIGAWFVYQEYVVAPKEKQAMEAMWKAESYYRMDSSRLALNGDGVNRGFVRIISQYGGTKAGNLARYYAGISYLKLGDFNNAIKQLKDFSTDDDLLKVRTAGALGDAYAESGKKAEAADQYRKAGTLYEEDNFNSPEYLFRAGLLYQELGKNKEAIEVFRIIKDKYLASQQGRDIDKYLARLGDVRD